jgi:D-inositol-3-phosphate glycosyltransferase
VLGTPSARARLASGARAHAEKFSWQRTVDGLLVAYREAIEEIAAATVASR